MMEFPLPPFLLSLYKENAEPLFVHGACSSLAGIGLVGLGLGDTLGQDLGVLVLFSTVLA